jgi:hypothetical protein
VVQSGLLTHTDSQDKWVVELEGAVVAFIWWFLLFFLWSWRWALCLRIERDNEDDSGWWRVQKLWKNSCS